MRLRPRVPIASSPRYGWPWSTSSMQQTRPRPPISRMKPERQQSSPQRQRRVIQSCNVLLYSIKPSGLKLSMKKPTLERVVAITPASRPRAPR